MSNFSQDLMQQSGNPLGSYNGSDFQAIVYMPIDVKSFQNDINKVENEIKVLQDRLYTITVSSDFYYPLYNQINILQAQLDHMEIVKSAGNKFVRPIKLGDIQTISISWFREKFPVRTFGRVYAKSYTRGARTIAGSMIFTLFNKQALWELSQAYLAFRSTGVKGSDGSYPDYSTVLVDQLPPFDLTLIASNEYGFSSYMSIYGMELVSGGMTISIQDLMTEDVMQFVARDFDPLRPMIEPRQTIEMGQPMVDASSIVKELKTEQQRRNTRLNPFI